MNLIWESKVQTRKSRKHYQSMNDKWIGVCGANKCGELGVGYERAPAMSKHIIPLQFNTSSLQKALPLPLQMLHQEDILRKQFFSAKQPEVLDIGCGAKFSLFLTKDPHLLWACGQNDYSNLGIPNEKSDNSRKLVSEDQSVISMEDFLHKETNVMTVSAVTVDSDCNMLRVVCGKEHAFLLLSNMTWMCSGSNSAGQLGFPDSVRRIHQFRPMKNLNMLKEPVTSIFCSSMGSHTFYLTESRKVYASGRNSCGNLGLGHCQRVYYPIQEVLTLRDERIVHIACGIEHSIFLSERGTLFGCGSPTFGKLGLHSSQLSVDTPQVIPFKYGKAIDASCGAHFTVITNELKEVYCCGTNDKGQLGLCSMTPWVLEFSKIQLSPPATIRSVKCGTEHTIFQTEDNIFYSAGDNTLGQLGLGHTVTWSSPRRIRSPILEEWKKKGLKPQVVCGSHHTIFYAMEPPETKIANHFKTKLLLHSSRFSDISIFISTH